jgi:hypothetical protein
MDDLSARYLNTSKTIVEFHTLMLRYGLGYLPSGEKKQAQDLRHLKVSWIPDVLHTTRRLARQGIEVKAEERRPAYSDHIGDPDECRQCSL